MAKSRYDVEKEVMTRLYAKAQERKKPIKIGDKIYSCAAEAAKIYEKSHSWIRAKIKNCGMIEGERACYIRKDDL